MIKKFYVLAWFLLIGSAAAVIFTGSLNGLSLVAFGLVAVGLVHGLALWSVLMNTSDAHPE